MKHPPWIFLVVLVLTAFVFVAPVCADALNGSPPFGQIVAITAQTSPVVPITAIESPFMFSSTETLGQPINGDAVKKIANTDNLAARIANQEPAIQKAWGVQHDVVFWMQAPLTTLSSTTLASSANEQATLSLKGAGTFARELVASSLTTQPSTWGAKSS